MAKYSADIICAVQRAIALDDWPSAAIAMEIIERDGLWRQAFLGIRRMPRGCCPRVAEGFHSDWTVRGHRIRQLVADDALLIDALHVLLPSYSGPGLMLYRGESTQRWRQRRIGSAWTSRIDIARMFGSGLNAINPGGGVLLVTEAPAEAIIVGPSDHSIYLDEHEYVVDRRLLNKISLLTRFPAHEENT